MTFVALLRAINVGGKSAVSMRALKACFEDIGLSRVRTYINSGNVIFDTRRPSPRLLERTIEKAIEKEFALPIRVLVRSERDIDRVVRSIPEEWRRSKALRSNVIFLWPSIDRPSILKAMRPRAGVDEVLYRKGVVLWSVPFEARTKSGLTRVVGDPIYKEMTIRSVNTTTKIRDMMRS